MNEGISRREWIKKIESQKIDSQFGTGFESLRVRKPSIENSMGAA
ncbi:MAG: hypothetical protein ACPG3V_03330 [Porticoccaceae bacterium]